MIDSQTNTFLGGMNLDLDITQLNDSQYRYAENIRISTNSDGTTGVLLNILSNKEILQFDDPIIYITNIDKYVVVITGGEEANKIYRLIVVDGEVIDNLLVSNINLGYTLDSKIKTTFSIESSENIKMYITSDDSDNMIRVINIMKDNTDAIVGSFDIIPNVIINKPEFVEYVTSTKIFKHKVVQYAVLFFNLRGSSSMISPVSDLIYSKTDAPHAIKIQFNCDTNFEYYRLYRVVYKDKLEMPIIEIISEQLITSNEVLYTDNGYNFISEITVDEFNMLSVNNFHAETIESKNNILFAANITPNTWDIEYDARAYRANSDGKVKLMSYGYNPGSIEFDINDIPDISEKHDCINPFNLDFEISGRPLPDIDPLYKYNTAGKLGGSGINIYYEFITRDVTFGSIDSLVYDELPDDIIRGYQRDEIYRFGIVFYNYKGVASPVHWIGDIRMPNFVEMPTFEYINDRVVCKPLGIEFTVNNVPSTVQSYLIVRCERTIEDRTILMQGVLSQVSTMPFNKSGEAVEFKNAIGTQLDIRPRVPLAMAGYDTYLTSVDDPIGGVSLDEFKTCVYTLAEEEGQGHVEPNYSILVSPEIDFNTFDYSDYLKKSKVDYLCWLNSSFGDNSHTLATVPAILNLSYSQDRLAYPVQDMDFKVGDIAKFVISGSNTVPIFKIGPMKVNGQALVMPLIFKRYNIEDLIHVDKLIINDAITPVLLENDSYQDLSTYYQPVGDKQYVNIGHTVNREVNTKGTFPNKNGHFGKCCVLYSSTPFLLNDKFVELNKYMFDIPLVNIKRDIVPYGGDSYTSRANSVYVGTDCFKKVFDQDLGDIMRGIDSIDVFGGDTIVTIHDHKTCCIPGLSSDYRLEYGATVFVSASDYIPFETTVNVSYADNINTIKTVLTVSAKSVLDLTKTESGTWVDPYLNTTIKGGTIGGVHAQVKPYYGYDDVYSVDSTSVKFVPKLPFTLDYQLPTRVMYSDVKTNNEVTDSWQRFKVGNYLDVDNKHGEITNLHIFLDKLFFFQDSAVGVLSVNERSLITDDNINLLTLGTGGILSRYDYATTTNGTNVINDLSIVNSPNGMYWFDPLVREICSFTNGIVKLSKVKNVQSYINKHSVDAVTSYYDNKFNEVCIAFKYRDNFENGLVLVYSEILLAFTSFYTFLPDKATSLSNYPLLVKDNKLYHNCRYEGDELESTIKFIVNKHPANTKVFDNVLFSGIFDNIREMLTDVTFLGKDGLATVHGGYNDGYDIDYREDTYRFAIGRNERETDAYSYPERMRGKYLACTYILKCDNQKEFNLPSITTTFRYSNL